MQKDAFSSIKRLYFRPQGRIVDLVKPAPRGGSGAECRIVRKDFTGPWEYHRGDDYAVVMLKGEDTSSASIDLGKYPDKNTDHLGALIISTPELRAQLDRANRIIGWMMPYIGSMCPPENGLGELNLHCMDNKVPDPKWKEVRGKSINQENIRVVIVK